jgi:hypothetical protein
LTIGFGLAVIAVVAIGRKMPVRDTRTKTSPFFKTETPSS